MGLLRLLLYYGSFVAQCIVVSSAGVTVSGAAARCMHMRNLSCGKPSDI